MADEISGLVSHDTGLGVSILSLLSSARWHGLTYYFRVQANRIAAAPENFQGLSPDQTVLVFSAEDEHEILMPIIGRNLGLLMLSGAESELEATEGLQQGLKVTDDFQACLRRACPIA